MSTSSSSISRSTIIIVKITTTYSSKIIYYLKSKYNKIMSLAETEIEVNL